MRIGREMSQGSLEAGVPACAHKRAGSKRRVLQTQGENGRSRDVHKEEANHDCQQQADDTPYGSVGSRRPGGSGRCQTSSSSRVALCKCPLPGLALAFAKDRRLQDGATWSIVTGERGVGKL